MDKVATASLYQMYMTIKRNHGTEKADEWVERELTDGEKYRLMGYISNMKNQKSAPKGFSFLFR